MLDKSPERTWEGGFMGIQNEFKNNAPNIVLCSEAFEKMEFLNNLINSADSPIIYVDLDLLYSGYIKSELIPKRERLDIFDPERDNWKEKFVEIISKASQNEFLVIVDSLNGMYSIFDELKSARFINSCLMLLASLGSQSRSTVVMTAFARKKENGGWTLTPGGKQIITSEKTAVYLLKKNQGKFSIQRLERFQATS